MHFVIIPGIDNSDQAHWQSIWETEWGASASRIDVASWERPELEDWCLAIARAVRKAGPSAVLVAHSLGCLAATRWAAGDPSASRGLFLVCPPDPLGPSFPRELASFAAVGAQPVQTPGLVVSSSNDQFCTPELAEQLAQGWELPLISVGPLGHINSASGLGRWEDGRALLTAFTAGLTAPSIPAQP